MSKKAYLISIGCFILGLVLGAIVTIAYSGKVAAEGIFLTRAAELAASSERADDAYQHESRPVAIYALSQHLATLKADEELGANPLTDKLGISIEMIMTHGQLAQLYDELGQTNISAQHVVEALRYARDSGTPVWVTNQTALAKFVGKPGTGKEIR
ncbi:MAG: hypothetical protein ABSH11_04315 [Verrucomicrobiota bacterium]|jgi:hypothetical protein